MPVAASGVRICWVIHSDLGGSLPVALIDRAIPGALRLHELTRDSWPAFVYETRCDSLCRQREKLSVGPSKGGYQVELGARFVKR